MSDDLNREIFKEEALELLGELESTLLELEQDPSDMDLVNRVFRALHTIKGSGAMFGFDAIASFTHEVETVFDEVRNGRLPVTHELITLVFRARDYIQTLLENEEGGDPVECDAILTELAAVASDVPQADDASCAPAAQVAAGKPEAGEEPSAPDFQSPGHPRSYHIHITPRDGHPKPFGRILPLLEELLHLGKAELEVDGLALEDVEVVDPEAEYHDWLVRLETSVNRQGVEDVFFFSEIDLDVDIREGEGGNDAPPEEAGESDGTEAGPAKADDAGTRKVAMPVAGPGVTGEADLGDADKMLGELLVEEGASPEAVGQALASQKALGEMLRESGAVSDEQVQKALDRQQNAREKKAKEQHESLSSIRVSAEKLDNLVDLVGELVIVQAQISQVVSVRNDPQLTSLAEQLERLSDELRDSTLGIRMLPIGSTFSKFRRLVRDLSGELGKEITLATKGAETELDKTVIERLGDPLVHLLRNSIDHGIESPEQRKAAGKPPSGTILLSAEHSGGEVLIRITDDGKGIDAQAIRAKAVEKGILSPEMELSEKDLYNLIFAPGFSTAAKVTSVSGRGVGMDVVKRAIDSLRGRILVDSRPGEGTTITIFLPLTLAIIEGLQVLVGNEYYVIPLSLVEECVELPRREDARDSIIHLRGEIVPYIHLRDWFEIGGTPPAIEQIVIVSVGGSRVGIVVDHVIGEHQTVIKTLGRIYRDVEGISGATIKGDGTMALILDIPRLVRSVERGVS